MTNIERAITEVILHKISGQTLYGLSDKSCDIILGLLQKEKNKFVEELDDEV